MTKIFHIGTKARLQANLDVYNALNDAAVLTLNNTYGSQWLRPQVILPARMFQLGGKFDF